jgi:hypothetical protein
MDDRFVREMALPGAFRARLVPNRRAPVGKQAHEPLGGRLSVRIKITQAWELRP